MRKALLTAALLSGLTISSALAADCGEMPLDAPAIPDGATAAADDIRDARNAVLEFSSKVDEYLTCMDSRAATILPYLKKEQQERWEKDLADLHDRRRDLQTQMNAAIRAYRRSTRN
jgi:hypothetical protein